MEPYEAAVKMFYREHARWNQWTLFFFGSIVSIFLLGEKLDSYIPGWIPPLVAGLISILWVRVAVIIRASTKAWRLTLLELESSGDKNADVFKLQESIWKKCIRENIFRKCLKFWDRETISSVTSILVLLGLFSALVFLALSAFIYWKGVAENPSKGNLASPSAVVLFFDRKYGGPEMDAVAEMTTAKFRADKPKSVWVVDTWKELKKINYRRLKSSVLGKKISEKKAVVALSTTITASVGEATQKEIFYLIKSNGKWLIDDLTVTDEDLEGETLNL